MASLISRVDSSPFFDSQRILRLFALNSIPSPQHEAEIRGYLLQLSNLSIQLQADTKDTLGESEEKQKLIRALELAKQLYRTIVSASRKLPQEILQRIFSFCVVGLDSEASSFKAALVLSHVSRNWRSAALSYPTLWSTLTIDMLKIAASSQTVSDVAILLERSKNIPLTVVLLARRSLATGGGSTILGQHDPHPVGNALISFLKVTLPSVCFRVRSLKLHCQSDIDLGPGQRSLSPLSAPPAPMLERLNMPVDLTRGPFMIHWMQALISGAPRLRYLSCRAPFTAIQNIVQWRNIEALDLLDPSNRLSCLNLLQISDLLSAAPTLRVLAVGLSDQPESPAGGPATLVLPSLRILTIHAHRTTRFGDFLDRFTLPSLLSLTISGIMEPWPEIPMRAFLARSRCPIKQLSVPDTPITPDILISHISTDVIHTSLEDLRLHKTSTVMVDRLLEHLTFQPNAPSYLNLHTLVCALSPMEHAQAFVRFVSSRLDPDASIQMAKLKRVHVNIPSDASQTNAALELVAFLITAEKIEASVVRYNSWDLENFNPPTPPTRDYGEEDCDAAPDHVPVITDDSCLDDLELAYPDDHEMRFFDGDYQPLTTDETTPALMETQNRLDPGVGETNEERRLPAEYPQSTGSSTPSPERKRRRFISERARMTSECAECGRSLIEDTNLFVTCSAGCGNRYHLKCRGLVEKPKSRWYCGVLCRPTRSPAKNKRKTRVLHHGC
ncbi:hypothetical protein PM082_011713 [Marasmius tenuissimus]|nr:hypothetical protein PM082_011713 [Marasmius tenuissimus]